MNSDYDVRLATLEAMGGDASKNYPSVYDVDLAILEAVEQGGGGIPDAPSDNKLYGRKDAAWTEVVIPSPGISDAPSDDKYYARRNATWSEVPSGGGISDAPIDGKKYARKDGAWAEVNEPDLTDYATKTWVGQQGYLTSVPSEYVTETELATELDDYATSSELTTGLNGKQDTISDLATIRSGAALGATALQSVPAGYATETWVGQQGYLTSIPVSYCQVVTLTQAQYDALATKDAHTLYIISDAS